MTQKREDLPFASAYLIGIKGAGMTALAQVFQGWGVAVSGSDTHEEFFTNEVLKKLGIPFVEGFGKENVPADVDAVFYSTAYGDGHPEVERARKLGVPMYTYTDGLRMILERGTGVGVAGTHGKTTTIAMIGKILEDAGFDPTVLVGGKVLQWETNARIGDSQWVIAEIDEYQEKFLEYPLAHVVVTSIEYDHPDYFPTSAGYEEAFAKLLKKLPDGAIVVYNKAYAEIRNIIGSIPDHARFRLFPYQLRDEPFDLLLPGKHNQENALAAFTLARALGIEGEVVRRSLAGFAGTARRFEIYGERPFTVIDDYAHHPRAIRVTIAAAREKYQGKNIWVVFHPHTFSRTKVLLHEFAEALSLADHAIVIDIYGSARERQGGVHSRDLAALVPNGTYVPTIEEAVAYLTPKLGADDVVITMGAGDVWRAARALSEQKKRSESR